MRENVYQGHDNLITLQLLDDSVETGTLAPSDLVSVTQMKLEFLDGTVLDSAVDVGVFDWSAGDGKVDLLLGLSSLPIGLQTATLIVIDPSKPEGIRWSPEIKVVVKEF